MQIISSYTCPFVQRAIITARLKGIDLDVTYIDLSAKPDWFLDISPTGRVPVLRTDTSSKDSGSSDVLFESAAICEYFNDLLAATPLLSADPHRRAQQRAWMSASDNSYGLVYQLALTHDPDAFADLPVALTNALTIIVPHLDAPLFDGPEPCLVDVFWYPLMLRIALIQSAIKKTILPPELQQWYDALSQRDAFLGSVSTDFADRNYQALRKSNSLLATQWQPAASAINQPAAAG